MPDGPKFLTPARLRALKRVVVEFFKHMGEPLADFVMPDEDVGGTTGLNLSKPGTEGSTNTQPKQG